MLNFEMHFLREQFSKGKKFEMNFFREQFFKGKKILNEFFEGANFLHNFLL